MEQEGTAAVAEAAQQAARVPAGQDPETQLVLTLFPGHVQAAILAALAAEEEAEAAAVAEAAAAPEEQAGGGATGATGGGGGEAARGPPPPVQLVEVKIDTGRPLALRLASRKTLPLGVDFGVQV